jgi:1-acyl-sn-glycerol-3-phosphate acyltransferase
MCNGLERISLHARLASLLRLVGFYLISAIWVPVIIVVAIMRPGSAYYPLARAWARFALAWFGIRVQTVGLANLEPGRDYVVLANHRSHFDPLALMAALEGHETRWVAKRELERVPIFGYGLRVTGQILIDRSDHHAAVDELKRHLGRKGASVVFFPEGRRAPGRELLRFKKGGVAFAIDAGLPIVPIAVSGSEKVLRAKSIIARPGTIRIEIGKPFVPGATGSADRDVVLARVHDTIAALLDAVEQPRATAARADALEPEAPPVRTRV